MKKVFFLIALVFSQFIYAQSNDPVVLSYQRNFVRASLSTKIELINDASRIVTVNMSPLYIDAMRFVINNLQILGNDSQLMDLSTIAATKSAQYKDQTVIPILKELFVSVTDSRSRIACLNAISEMAIHNTDESPFLINWLSTALDEAENQKNIDLKTLTACVVTLGKLKNQLSFPVLFRVVISSLDSSLIKVAETAINQIDEGYTKQILGKIEDPNVLIMYQAFNLALKKENLSPSDRGRISQAVFVAVLDILYGGKDQSSVKSTSQSLVSTLLQEALQELTVLKWSEASPSVVKYFYFVQSEFKTRKVSVESLLPVIHCMGSMGTNDSAQALSIFLGLLNSETEQKKTYNEQLMLAVIQALGDLGDKTAFDYLLYVGYLDYPETVKKASRDALARLQW
ncbi:MAG TPA: hypothetical protein VJ861_02205 [Treponemataceae bacterium]|nr:hypothetical protein [Treponemataceae bacterium]